jgi:hypothetical protein
MTVVDNAAARQEKPGVTNLERNFKKTFESMSKTREY